MRVLCAGLATEDTIIAVQELPASDGRVVAQDAVTAGGGPAATAAVTLARLGVDTAFAGAVGDDAAGAFVLDGLAAEGVDVARVVVASGARTSRSTILVAGDGSRAIVHVPGDAPFPTDLDATGFDWVHVDHAGYGSVWGRLSVDGGNPITGLDLRAVELYAPTAVRLREDFGDAQGALDAGARLVVVTRGANGSSALSASEAVEARGVACESCISTLGAGDVFHGALLAYLCEGAALAHALRAANTAASLSCRALDGRSAIPTRVELEAALG
jgi:sugar/nucleoside kinase (ribokinase family)